MEDDAHTKIQQNTRTESEVTQESSVPKKQKNIALIVVSTLFVLLLGIVGAGLGLGYLRVKPSLLGTVGGQCHSIIGDYNMAAVMQESASAGTDVHQLEKEQQSKFDTISNRIDAISGSEEDANCMQMKLGIAMNSGNIDQAKTAARQLVKLSESGEYATAQIVHVTSIRDVIKIANTVSAEYGVEGDD